MKYKYSVLGGTFDRFHIGHKKLLDTAFSQSEKLGIGIATPSIYKDKYRSHIIEDYQARETAVKKYLMSKGLLERTNIMPINDIYGNTLDNVNIDAIFATEENLSNIKKINSKRSELGMKMLQVEEVSYVLSDDGEPVSSVRIRKGEIDRDGHSYFKLFFEKKKFILADEMRDSFKKPFGKVIKDIEDIDKYLDSRNMLFAIGDIIVLNLLKQKIQAEISIIDFKTKRQPIDSNDEKTLSKLSNLSNVIDADNTPGTIERRAVGAIRKALYEFYDTAKKQIIKIKGEEDLLVLPIIGLSPLESVVLYGQPDKGIVVIKVTEKKKKEVERLLGKFK